MDFGTPGTNLAVETLLSISNALKIEGSDVSRESISDKASETLSTWVTARNITDEAISKRGRTIVADDKAIFCFSFSTDEPKAYSGTVCVSGEGAFVGEDSTQNS